MAATERHPEPYPPRRRAATVACAAGLVAIMSLLVIGVLGHHAALAAGSFMALGAALWGLELAAVRVAKRRAAWASFERQFWAYVERPRRRRSSHE